jgi:hypothetical protein
MTWCAEEWKLLKFLLSSHLGRPFPGRSSSRSAVFVLLRGFILAIAEASPFIMVVLIVLANMRPSLAMGHREIPSVYEVTPALILGTGFGYLLWTGVLAVAMQTCVYRARTRRAGASLKQSFLKPDSMANWLKGGDGAGHYGNMHRAVIAAAAFPVPFVCLTMVPFGAQAIVVAIWAWDILGTSFSRGTVIQHLRAGIAWTSVAIGAALLVIGFRNAVASLTSRGIAVDTRKAGDAP